MVDTNILCHCNQPTTYVIERPWQDDVRRSRTTSYDVARTSCDRPSIVSLASYAGLRRRMTVVRRTTTSFEIYDVLSHHSMVCNSVQFHFLFSTQLFEDRFKWWHEQGQGQGQGEAAGICCGGEGEVEAEEDNRVSEAHSNVDEEPIGPASGSRYMA